MSGTESVPAAPELPRINEELIGYGIWAFGFAAGFFGWAKGWSLGALSPVLYQWSIVPIGCVLCVKVLGGKTTYNSNIAVFLLEKSKIYAGLILFSFANYLWVRRPEIRSAAFGSILDRFTLADIFLTFAMIPSKLGTLNGFSLLRRLALVALCAVVISLQLWLIAGAIWFIILFHPEALR